MLLLVQPKLKTSCFAVLQNNLFDLDSVKSSFDVIAVVLHPKLLVSVQLKLQN
jgi:hypothetical protein